MNNIARVLICAALCITPASADELEVQKPMLTPLLPGTVSKEVLIDADRKLEPPHLSKDFPSWRWNVPVVHYTLRTQNGVVKTYW